MIRSRYTLVSVIDKDNFAVYTPLSGAFDIADKESVERINAAAPRDDNEKSYWLDRGYFFETRDDEERYIQQRYEEFVAESEQNPVQFVFVPTYSCNFSCDYCYQQGISRNPLYPSREIIDAFVQFITEYRDTNHKEIYVTLFGGEPLQDLPQAYDALEYLLTQLTARSIGIAIVTNGFHLIDFLPIINKGTIRELHISLDGDQPVHDKRRQEDKNSSSFERIMQGIHRAVDLFLPVNVRIIIDKETMPTLPKLAERLQNEGFLDLPKTRFKTSLGRNYELINEYKKSDFLYTLDEMYQEYTELMISYPLMKKLHTPSFFGITHMVETGEMYLPNFDSCPAYKSEYAFDYTGGIFGCTASCGRTPYKSGTFYPKVEIYENEVAPWKKRSVLTIDTCRECSVGVVCGGGCGVIAHETHGNVDAPDCKPVKNIMDLGIRYYKDRFLNAE